MLADCCHGFGCARLMMMMMMMCLHGLASWNSLTTRGWSPSARTRADSIGRRFLFAVYWCIRRIRGLCAVLIHIDIRALLHSAVMCLSAGSIRGGTASTGQRDGETPVAAGVEA